ncbi:MAG: PAS domain-containing protein, partial [Firmicutes bacterium]|nr:PAS domain-containing protein [Bacillota bacterium]
MQAEKCKYNDYCRDLEHLRLQLRELEAVFENCRDGISIVDKHGVIMRSNPAMQRLYKLSGIDYVGKNVLELVRDGVFNTSVSIEVISSGQSVSMLQDINTGTRCLTTGAPI